MRYRKRMQKVRRMQKIAGLTLAIVLFASPVVKIVGNENEKESVMSESAMTGVDTIQTMSGSVVAETEIESTVLENVTSETGKETSTSDNSDAAVDKEETVYVNADAEGNVEEVTVEVVLKNDAGSNENGEESSGNDGESDKDDEESSITNEDTSEILDVSNLTDIKNTEGDEEYMQQGNKIYWQNHGEDIYYKGTSTADLPVSVTVSYYLDGEKMNPEDIAGKSGKVRIRFDYENKETDTVEIDGEEYTVHVPFLAVTAAFLSDDIFKNIEVTNGKLVSLDDQNIVIGMAYPGLKDSLKLADYEPTEDIDIPEYVELTADVTDFALDFTATVITPGTFADMDFSDIEDAKDLSDSMDELQEASGELVEGTGELLTGMETFQTYLSAFTEGTSELKKGTQTLAKALKTLNRQKKKLLSGAVALVDGISTMNEQLENVSLPSASSLDITSIEDAAEALGDDAQDLASQMKSLQTALDTMQDVQEAASDYADTVEEKTNAAKDSLSAIDWSSIETTANQTAKEQVNAALQEALAETGLSEEEKASIIDKVTENIQIESLTETAQSQVSDALTSLGEMPAWETSEDSEDLSTNLSDTMEKIQDSINDMQTQLSVLETFSGSISQLSGSLGSLNMTLSTLKTGLSTLEEGSDSLAQGIRTYNKGIGQIYSGSVSLDDGTAELTESSASLSEGFSALTEGVEALKDGMATFDEEGIQSLSELIGEEFEEVLARLRALQKADKNYDNFSGLAEGKTGNVKFIIETEEIG